MIGWRWGWWGGDERRPGMTDSVCWVALWRRNELRRQCRVSVYLYGGGEPCKIKKKLNGNGDLRCFGCDLIRSSIAVTPARRDVDIKLAAHSPNMLSDRIYKPSAQELVYHYCTPETFLAICSGKKLRFSDLFAMNDFMELHWGYSMWEEAATRLGRNHEVARSFLDEVDRVIHATGRRTLALASCLSRNGDVLSQWRAYADDGREYAVGFHAQTIQLMAVRAFRVEYAPEAQIAEVSTLVRKLYADFAAGDRGEASAFQEACEFLAIDLAAFKNPAFSEEDEVRLVHALAFEPSGASAKLVDSGGTAFDIPTERVPVAFHMRDGIPVAHVDLDFAGSVPPNIVREVVIGPRCPALPSGISIFLETIGLTNVTVRKSLASYR